MAGASSPTPTATPAPVTGTSSNGWTPPACTDVAPLSPPDLFQINAATTSSTLYFTPVNGQSTKYAILYGYNLTDERFGVEFQQGVSSGVLSYTINALAPNTTYYFKVRGGNGCMPGPWSNSMSATTEKDNNKDTTEYYKNFPSRLIQFIMQLH